MRRRDYPALAGRGGIDSGVRRLLETPLVINGAVGSTILRFVGSQAAAGGWPEYGGAGTLALQAGTAPTYGVASPFAGSLDGGVKFNAGGYFTEASMGNVTTEDLVIEVVFSVTAASTIIDRVTAGAAAPGWVVYSAAGASVSLGINATGAGFVAVASDAIAAGAVVHGMVFADRSGSMKWYINGVASSAAQLITSYTGSLTTAQSIAIGAYANSSGPMAGSFFYAHVAYRSNWLDTHLQPALAAQRFALLTGTRPLISIASATSLAAGGNAGPAYQERIVSSAQRLFYMGAGAPRFVQRLDSAGRSFTGALVEAGAVNGIFPDTGTPAVLVTNVTIGTGESLASNPSIVAKSMVETTATNVHCGVFNAATPGKTTLLAVIKKPSSGGRRYVYLSLANDGGAGTGDSVILDLDTGTLSAWIHHGGAQAGLLRSVRQLAPGEFLVTLTISAGVNNTSSRIGISSNGTSVDSFTGDPTTYPNGIQYAMVNGTIDDYPSSPINTTTGAVTRAADAPHRLSGAAHFGATGFALWGSLLAPVWTPSRSHYLWTAYKAGSAATEYVTCFLDTAGNLNLASASAGGAAGAVITVGTFNTDLVTRFCVSFGENSLRLWTRGATGGWIEATPDVAVHLPAGLDTLDWGADNAAANQAGPVLPGARYQLLDHPVLSPLPEPGGFEES